MKIENKAIKREIVINHCTVTPVRQEPTESSEQLTQLLFGEPCEVLDRLPRWTKVRSCIDGQEGWVDFKMMQESLDNVYNITHAAVAVPIAVATSMETGEEIMLTLGTPLPGYKHGTFEVLQKRYLIHPKCVSETHEVHKEWEISHVAQSLLNTPYLWGGKNAMGMDCSGFTQVVYSVFGINLLRNAREQITQGIHIERLEDTQVGDLVFFDHADRDPKATNISHVGLLLSPTEVIHCSGCVHIDTIDKNGIHLSNGELTHHLVEIRRYFGQ